MLNFLSIIRVNNGSRKPEFLNSVNPLQDGSHHNNLTAMVDGAVKLVNMLNFMKVELGDKNTFRSKEVWRSAGAEFVATLLFVYIGCGAVVATGTVNACFQCWLGLNKASFIPVFPSFFSAFPPHSPQKGGGNIRPFRSRRIQELALNRWYVPVCACLQSIKQECIVTEFIPGPHYGSLGSLGSQLW